MCVRGGFGNNALVALVIFGIIFAIIVALAVTVGYFALLIILGIGLSISLIYSLYIFIKNFIGAAKTLGGVSASTPIKTFFLRWATLIKDTSVNSMRDNFAVCKNSFLKARMYRIISIGKWSWLLIAIGTLIFGTMLIALLIAVHVVLAVVAIAVAAALICVVCLIFILIGLFYAVAAVIKCASTAFSGHDNIFKSFEFTSYATFTYYADGVKGYFITFGDYIKSLWSESLALCKNNAGMASGYGVLSPKRYFLYLSLVAIVLIAVLLTVFIAVGLFIVFLVLAFVNLLWTSIVVVINAIRNR